MTVVWKKKVRRCEGNEVKTEGEGWKDGEETEEGEEVYREEAVKGRIRKRMVEDVEGMGLV